MPLSLHGVHGLNGKQHSAQKGKRKVTVARLVFPTGRAEDQENSREKWNVVWPLGLAGGGGPGRGGTSVPRSLPGATGWML